MAEFKLGRIRFVWKNQWSADTVYYQDDVVAFGGKTYICVLGHTSQTDFFSDLDIVPPKWNLVSEGQTWKGEWQPSTDYVYDDIVSYGARLYICNTIHTSAATAVDATDGLEVDSAKWDIFAEGLDWKGDWTVGTRYKINDVVKYGGTTYVCNTLHVSAATETLGLEADQSKWDYFNQGIDYKGDWASATRYKINDLVRYGAGIWIATAEHTSSAAFGTDGANWEKFVEGFQFEDEWTHSRRYQPGDVVRYGGNQYLAKLDHVDVSPAASVRTITNITNADPAVVTVPQHNLNDGRQITLTGVEGMTSVNGEVFYAKVVDADTIQLYTDAALTTTFNSTAIAAYTSAGETNATIPPQWELFSQGLRFIGDWNGDSSGALYKTGDVVRQGGYTYRAIKDHTDKQPPNAEYWEKLNSGFDWRGEWQDDQEYFVGDVVRYGDNSYVCTQGHISEGDDGSSLGGAPGSRPDLADSGQYWSVLAIGSEQSVLTTPGDLLYFSGEVPTRLPIGLEGQVLRVDENNLPAWEFLQSVEDVYYVSEEGQDRPYPEYGSNVDRPFKTIRYACEQIENGAKNPNAQFLLESNRNFIQREVSSWIRDQVDNAVGGSIWENFTFDTVKCERDVGFVVDRIIHDLGHGGNLKTRAAAQTFLNALDDGPYSTAEENNGTGPYGNLAEEGEQSVAAYQYMVTLFGNVLANEVPDVIYQNVTDDSTAIVEQYINVNLEAESGTLTRVTELANIVINALDTGLTSSIPDREVVHSLVKVSTGYFYEVLPIVVPAYTAILGDELRSTHIIAAEASIPSSDSAYTVESYDRITEIIGDIVVGNSVTPTTGNTKVQSTEWPLAIAEQATAVEDLVKVMKYQTDYLLNTMHSAYFTEPVSFLGSDQYIARENIKANRDFIIAEVIAYLEDQYPDLKYGKTDTRRDARYVLDSLEYDLTYGGNSLAVLTGLAYYDGDDNTLPQIPASIETATINALNYLKTTAQNVAGNTTIVNPYQTAVSQVVTGNVGSITEIANNVEDIVEIIETGPAAVGTTVTLTDPTPTNGENTTTALINASNALVAAEDTVIQNMIDDLNATAWHTDFTVESSGLTSTEFSVYVGKHSLAHTYVSGGTVTKSNGTVLEISDFVYNESTGFATVTTTTHGLSADDIVTIEDITVSCTSGGETSNYVFPSATSTSGTRTKVFYLQNKCIRDIRKLLKAVRFDFMFNTNFQTLKHAHAYLRGTALEVYTGNQKTVTRSAIENALATEAIANVGGDTTAIARIQESAAIIDAIIFGATNDGSVCQTEDQNVYYAIQQLERNRDFIVDEVRAWMNYNYVNFNDYYNAATCARDIGMIIDAVSYDLITGSNFPSSVAGAAYYRIQSAVVTSAQMMQTVAAIKEARRLVVDIVAVNQRDEVVISFNNIINILENGLSAVPTYTFPDNGTTAADDSTTAGTFQTNRATIISDVSSWLASNQTTQWNALGAEGQATCQRDMGYIIDAATYDVLYGGNYQSVIAGDSYYSFGTLQIGTGDEKVATLAALGQLKAELVADAEAASQTAVGDNMDDIIAIVTNGAGTVTTTYPVATGESTAIQTAYTDIQDGKVDTQTAVTTYITNTFSSYTYDEALCLRDVNKYIDALKYDLKYPGNYKSRYVARYYANAAKGSQEEDMFYLRDATGVRNCTLNGLNGDLTPANEYGTSRTTAGAYCSLDPGFGPDDFTTWIITRSPYIQGVTTFGNGAIGQKIDGALHNGGNDSMVSNDFTQVISDGIGAYITNNGRAELVSVFTYYSHIGYLAEAGGRIRATNGNNSYGTFGSVAEGVDPDETPVTAIVDNITQYNATISDVYTDNSQFLQLEFNHAGNNYTEVEYSTFGIGSDADFIGDEFRDDGVNYVQVAQDPDPTIPIGGSGYVIVSNTAQTGATTSVTLAATDGALSSAYPGMKVYIIGGAGVGQYGIIDTYNAGSKVATVVRESDGVAGWDHIIAGTTITAPNASSTYQIEPAISFTSPTHSDTNMSGLPSSTWYDAGFVETAGEYTGVATTTGGNGTGATVDVVRNGSKYYVSLNDAGTGYSRLDTLTVLGTNLGGSNTTNDITITVTSVNSVTGAIVDFDFTGFGSGGVFVALGAGSQGALSSGTTWSSTTLPSLATGNWSNIASGLQDDGSSTFKPHAAVIVADGAADVGYIDPTLPLVWNSTTLPAGLNTSGENSIAFGNVIGTTSNRFVVISDSDTDVAYSDNGGATWTLTSSALPATGFDEIAYGNGRWVAINSGTTSAVYSDDGITWVGVTAPAAFAAATDIAWGNNKFVALGGTDGIMYSFDGTEWFENALALPITATERRIAYGQGMFVITSDDAFSSPDLATLQYSQDGLYWQTYDITSVGFTAGTDAIAFGNPDRSGQFVVLGPSSTGAAKVNLGATAKGRASIASEQLFEVRITEPGSGYTSDPTITVTDPNNIDDVVLVSQTGKGVLAQPTFYNRGTGYTTASAEIDSTNSNGEAEFPQSGSFIAVRRLSARPVPGSNVEFDSLPGEFYKLVNTVSFVGLNDGSYTAFLQISPEIAVEDAPPDADPVELRIRFSQVRLTGHDFLDIGTGGFTSTNYPNTPLIQPDQDKETTDSDGGRVFYTATDQDGNFRVGDLFTIEQSTGVATLNADAFNIAGLQELSLGEVTLGGNSATVNEFSTDPFFTANSDSIIPTQRAIKAYIESQIGGGGATLNVNSVTAGDIFIGTDTITTVSGSQLNIKANVVFSGSVLGLPLAYNYFLR